MINREELDCLIPLKFSPTCACLDSWTRLPQPCSSGPLSHRAIANVPLPGCQNQTRKNARSGSCGKDQSVLALASSAPFPSLASLEDVVQADANVFCCPATIRGGTTVGLKGEAASTR